MNEFSLNPDYVSSGYKNFSGDYLLLHDKSGNIQINAKGEILNKFKVDNAPLYFVSANLLVFNPEDSNKYGVMDVKGNIIIKADYEDLEVCDDGLIIASDDKGKMGVINLKGKTIIPFNFCCILESTPRAIFSEGLTFASKENITSGKVGYIYGYINEKGDYVLIYDAKTKTFKKVDDSSR